MGKKHLIARAVGYKNLDELEVLKNGINIFSKSISAHVPDILELYFSLAKNEKDEKQIIIRPVQHTIDALIFSENYCRDKGAKKGTIEVESAGTDGINFRRENFTFYVSYTPDGE